MKLNENTILIISIVFSLIGFFIAELYKARINNLVVKNRNDYEIFDNCYLVKENYYCEKTD